MAFASLACAAAIAQQPIRDVRILVVLRATEQPNHIFVAGMKNEAVSVGRVFGAPSLGRSKTNMLHTRVTFLNDTFVAAIA